MIPSIEIKAIPHKKHRYPTVGDYWESKGWINFRVSELPDWRWEFLVIIHELVEWALVKHAGIDLKKIDEFDIEFERQRKALPNVVGDSEPGDDLRAPYYRQHQIATLVEKGLAFALGVDWNHYDKFIADL